MMPGWFVVIEGPEGSGKSTRAAAVGARLAAAGVDMVPVREPGGTPVAEAARRAMLEGGHDVAPLAELFLILAARADLVAAVIRPALAAGKMVLADRFDLSTLAYQVAGRGLDEDTVRQANAAATGGLGPDLTLVLDLPPGQGLDRQRAAGKRQDRLDLEDPAFHARVDARYRATDGAGIAHIDADCPPDQLLDRAWAVLATARPDLIAGTPPVDA